MPPVFLRQKPDPVAQLDRLGEDALAREVEVRSLPGAAVRPGPMRRCARPSGGGSTMTPGFSMPSGSKSCLDLGEGAQDLAARTSSPGTPSGRGRRRARPRANRRTRPRGRRPPRRCAASARRRRGRDVSSAGLTCRHPTLRVPVEAGPRPFSSTISSKRPTNSSSLSGRHRRVLDEGDRLLLVRRAEQQRQDGLAKLDRLGLLAPWAAASRAAAPTSLAIASSPANRSSSSSSVPLHSTSSIWALPGSPCTKRVEPA